MYLEKEKFFIELTEILELDEKVKGDFNLENSQYLGFSCKDKCSCFY